MTPEPDYSAEPWERMLAALRKPDPSIATVPNVVRQSMADVVVGLVQKIGDLEQRQRDTDWLQMAAFRILRDHNVKPSSADLIDAYKRAKADDNA